MQREGLFRLPLAVKPAVDGREPPDLLHLAGVIVGHADHKLEEELRKKVL
jgi:hypothetical protein